MLEMAVVMVVGSILLLLVVRWVTGLIAITSDASQRTAVVRDATALTGQLSVDLADASSCSPTGVGPTLAFLSPYNTTTSSQSFGVFTTNDATATPSDPALVIWTFYFDSASPATLVSAQRTDLGPISGGCPAVSPPTGFNAATNTQTAQMFSGGVAPAGIIATPVTKITGVGGSNPSYTGSCVPASSFNCDFTGLQFNFIMRTPAGLPDIVNQVIPLAQSNQAW